jgi:signal transduction histidine kinase
MYIPSNIISLIYIFVKYIIVYKKIDKHTKARREKIMIEKQKNIITCITIDNGKRYGKTKKRTIEQRIN